VIEVYDSRNTGTSSEYSSLRSTETETPTVENPSDIWKNMLRNYMENVPAFFLVVFAMNTAFIGFASAATFDGVYYAFVVLVALFITSRFVHAFVMYKGFVPARGIAFGVGAVLTTVLALFAAVLSFVGIDNPLLPKATVVVTNVIIAILVFKIYTVHVTVGRARHSGNTEIIPTWLNITRNDVESFVPFAGIIPIWVSGQIAGIILANAKSLQIAGLFFVCLYASARISHTVCYAYRVQPWRSASFAVGLLSLFLVGWMGTGTIIHLHTMADVKVAVALSVIIMLDLMRTWGVGFATAVNRGKAGKVIAEEDRRLPGFKEGSDNAAEALSDILATVQTKDCQIGMVFYIAVHLLAAASLESEAAVNGYIAIICLFFFSRVAYTILAVLKMRELVLSCVAMFSVLLVFILVIWNIALRIKQFA